MFLIFLLQGNVKILKTDENCKYSIRKSSYLVNNCRNFHEILKQNVT